MDHPHNATELCMFIGCVNYHRDMQPSHAHILKQLTDQPSLKKKAPIKWTDEMQKVFDKTHLLMAANALAAYLDHNKQFNIYVDPHTRTISLCIQGVPVCKFLAIPDCMHTGINCMHTGISICIQ
jgi:hypothetical protein